MSVHAKCELKVSALVVLRFKLINLVRSPRPAVHPLVSPKLLSSEQTQEVTLLL